MKILALFLALTAIAFTSATSTQLQSRSNFTSLETRNLGSGKLAFLTDAISNGCADPGYDPCPDGSGCCPTGSTCLVDGCDIACTSQDIPCGGSSGGSGGGSGSGGGKGGNTKSVASKAQMQLSTKLLT
ncbi:10615_t:CDS:2, partial [Paraglomus brasilianum]